MASQKNTTLNILNFYDFSSVKAELAATKNSNKRLNKKNKLLEHVRQKILKNFSKTNEELALTKIKLQIMSAKQANADGCSVCLENVGLNSLIFQPSFI